jgi:hypothetical protein
MVRSEPAAQIADAPRQQERADLKWLVVFLALALLRGALYAIVVPPWQHPDEPTHFEYVRIIAETGVLPASDYISLPIRREIVASMVNHAFWQGITQPPLTDSALSAVGISPLGVYTLTQPKLYYVLAALWLRPWLGHSVDFQLYVVRALSVLLNLLVVASAFFTTRILFPGRATLLIAVVGLVVFQPGYTDIMSSVNNDALVNAFSAGFFLAAAWVYMRGMSWRAAILAVLCLAGALLSKATAVVVLCAVPFGVIFYPWRGKVGNRRVIGVVIFGMVALAGVGVALSRADNPLLEECLALIGQYFRMDVLGTWQALTAPGQYEKYYLTAITVFKSFWAAFGWRHVLLASEWYWLPGLATVVAATGLLWQGLGWLRGRAQSNDDERRPAYLLFATSSVILASAAAIVRSQAVQGMSTYLSHGRYVFVALVPFALLFTLGLQQWMSIILRRWWLIAYLIALVGFDALAFWGYLVPFYYK